MCVLSCLCPSKDYAGMIFLDPQDTVAVKRAACVQAYMYVYVYVWVYVYVYVCMCVYSACMPFCFAHTHIDICYGRSRAALAAPQHVPSGSSISPVVTRGYSM